MKGSDLVLKTIPEIDSRYLAGSDGNIYSQMRRKMRKLMSSKCAKGNYLHVSVLDIHGERKSVMVHLLVCSAFKGVKPSEYHQVSHEDGDSCNNLLDNLKWRLVKDNHKLKLKHGTHDGGLNNSRCIIDKEKLFVVRYLLSNTELSHSKIGDILNLNRVFVSKINNNSRYKHSKVKVVEE